MRASPWRSLIRLWAPALLVAACTPKVDLDGRPPPCAPNYALCESTGVCVHPEDLDYNKPVNQGPDAVCPIALMVRQGASIAIPILGTRNQDLQLISGSDRDAHVSDGPSLPGSIVVTAAHGTFTGSGTKDGADRVIKFRATVGGVTLDRRINIIVSGIAAAANGDDNDVGSREKPFRTFAHAAAIAQPGDTIVLSNGMNGMPADGENAPEITLPPNIIVEGQDVDQTLLYMRLKLQGDTTFQRIYFKRERLVIEVPRTHVALRDCKSAAGVEVVASAAGTDLSFSGDDSEFRADDGEHDTVLVAADDSTVTVETGAVIRFTGDETLTPVHLTGNGQNLNILERAGIWNYSGARSVYVEGATAAVVIGATLSGLLDISNAKGSADIWNATFLTGPGGGGLHFTGSTLKVQGSLFKQDGIEQESPASHATIRGTRFTQYPRFGYHLLQGLADLGTDTDPGNNTFTWETAVDPDAAATALVNDAPGTTSSMVVSASQFDVMLPKAPCLLTGPDKLPGLYKLADKAILTFY
jgi:hypothetical protein